MITLVLCLEHCSYAKNIFFSRPGLERGEYFFNISLCSPGRKLPPWSVGNVAFTMNYYSYNFQTIALYNFWFYKFGHKHFDLFSFELDNLVLVDWLENLLRWITLVNIVQNLAITWKILTLFNKCNLRIRAPKLF